MSSRFDLCHTTKSLGPFFIINKYLRIYLVPYRTAFTIYFSKCKFWKKLANVRFPATSLFMRTVHTTVLIFLSKNYKKYI